MRQSADLSIDLRTVGFIDLNTAFKTVAGNRANQQVRICQASLSLSLSLKITVIQKVMKLRWSRPQFVVITNQADCCLTRKPLDTGKRDTVKDEGQRVLTWESIH